MDEIDTSRIASVGVDRDTCQSAATCLAYRIYLLDDEAKAVLLTANGQDSDTPGNPQQQDGFVGVDDLLNEEKSSREDMQRLVLESAQACPFNAIIVRDEEGNQVWPPL